MVKKVFRSKSDYLNCMKLAKEDFKTTVTKRAILDSTGSMGAHEASKVCSARPKP